MSSTAREGTPSRVGIGPRQFKFLRDAGEMIGGAVIGFKPRLDRLPFGFIKRAVDVERQQQFDIVFCQFHFDALVHGHPLSIP